MSDAEETPIPAPPASLLEPGAWRIEASYRTREARGRVSGEGDGVDGALREVFASAAAAEIREAQEERNWRVDALVFDGRDLSADAVQSLYAADAAIDAFGDWEDAEAMRAVIRARQEARAVYDRVEAMKEDARWMLAVRAGGYREYFWEAGGFQWTVLPRHLEGTGGPSIPAFLLEGAEAPAAG